MRQSSPTAASRGSSIAPKGIPHGLDRLLSADIFPDGAAPAERITLVDASGTKRVELEAFDGSPLVQRDAAVLGGAVVTARAQRRGRRYRGPGSAASPDRRGPRRRVGRGAEEHRGVDAGDGRGRMAEAPRPRRRPAVDGAVPAWRRMPTGSSSTERAAGTRWGVAFSRGPGLAAVWTQIVTADLSSGGGGTGVPDRGAPRSALGGERHHQRRQHLRRGDPGGRGPRRASNPSAFPRSTPCWARPHPMARTATSRRGWQASAAWCRSSCTTRPGM